MIHIDINECSNSEMLRLTGEYLIKLADLNRPKDTPEPVDAEPEPTKGKKRAKPAATSSPQESPPSAENASGSATTAASETHGTHGGEGATLPAVTLEEVRALLKSKFDAGKRKQVQDLIAEYNVINLTQIPASELAGLYAKGEQL